MKLDLNGTLCGTEPWRRRPRAARSSAGHRVAAVAPVC